MPLHELPAVRRKFSSSAESLKIRGRNLVASKQLIGGGDGEEFREGRRGRKGGEEDGEEQK